VLQPGAFARTGLCCPCRQRSDAPIRRRAGSVRLPVVPVICIGCSWRSLHQGRRRPPQLPCLLCDHPVPPTPGSSSAPARSGLQRLGWPCRDFSGSALPCPLAGLASRGCRIALVLRAGHLLPPGEGLSTLGFDTGRFPPMPPACYRASWQLPRPDFHRQQTRACRRGLSQVHRLLSSVTVAHASSAEEGSASNQQRNRLRLRGFRPLRSGPRYLGYAGLSACVSCRQCRPCAE